MSNPFLKFRDRSTEEEIMDDLSCNGLVVEQTLRELDYINSWLGGNAIVLNSVKKVFESWRNENANGPIKIIDIGCGSGTILKEIAVMAKNMGVSVSLNGIDANPFIIDYARKNCEYEFPDIRFEVMNILDKPFTISRFDIAVCSLFCHHFTNQQLSSLINDLRRITNKSIIINDIHRHWIAYYSIKWLTILFSNSEMVKYDSKLSVLRAFTKNDLKKVLKAAKIDRFSIRWKWAFRYEVLIDCQD